MAKRTLPKNTTQTTSNISYPSTNVAGHVGHVLTVYADYAVFCETDGVHIPTESVAGLAPGK